MELIDPCAAATVSIREAGLAPQEYSITNNDATYRPSPLFRENQGICVTQITASEATLLPSGARRLTAGEAPLTFDESLQRFTFARILDDLTLAGQTETAYTITMNYKVFSIYAADPAVPTYDEEKTFTWTVKNPCIDDTLVSITKPDDLGTGLTYNLGSGPLELPAHGLFEIDFKNKNVPNDLCGDLTFEAKYENGAIGSSPVTAYDPTTRVFTIESSDATLDSTSKTISVTASLVNYNPDDDALFSSADQQTSSSQISFIGCNFPTLAEIQDSSEEIGPNKYDDLPVTFDASTLFTIAPSSCDITYSCSTVDALPCDDAGSVTSFDTTTGVFTFQAGTDQFSTYPPGTYSFTVTGSTDVGSESVEFTLTLVDLCIEDVQLSLTANPSDF